MATPFADDAIMPSENSSCVSEELEPNNRVQIALLARAPSRRRAPTHHRRQHRRHMHPLGSLLGVRVAAADGQRACGVR